LVFASLVFIATFSEAQSSLNFESYLRQVQLKNRNLLSLQESLAAVEGRFAQSDLSLSPVLLANIKQSDDRATSFLSPTLTRTRVQQYDLGLAKSFSSGTSVQVMGIVQELKLDFSGATPAQQLGQSSMVVSLSQSLWKNFFGSATRLRWQRESELRKLENLSLRLKLEQALIEAEKLFWDVQSGEEELQIRKASLERARRIEKWVSKRVTNGIGDKADLYNAKALVAARELQLLKAQDESVAREKSLRLMLELEEAEKTPSLKQATQANTPFSKVSKKIRMDAYLNYLEAQAKALASKESMDGFRPDLTLEGQYKTNGYDSDLSGAAGEIQSTDKPTQNIALRLTWILDDGTKSKALASVKAEALSARLRSEKSLIESTDSYIELVRRNEELSKMIQVAEEYSRLQLARASAEREKLSKGRSVTSQAITAEQEADEAELQLTNLRAQQKKLESQFRLFIDRPEGV
jgi:outer membrane protein TolC